MSGSWSLWSMTFLMTWSLSTSGYHTASLTILVALGWKALCCCKAQFFLFLKSSGRRMLEQEIWGYHMWTMRRSAIQIEDDVKLMFQAADISSRIRPSPLHSIVCHSKNVPMFHCRICDRFAILIQDFLPFSFLNSCRAKCRSRHQGAFLSRPSFQYDAPIW